MTGFNIFWVIFIVLTLLPLFRQRQVTMSRFKLIKRIQRIRAARLITLIHRQESISILGIPLRRYIDVEDSEQILRAIRLTPDNMPIDLVLHTPGGLVLAAEQIARALAKHPARVTVLVPHYAMSGGTMIALAADEIIMDENAVLGPVDPQLGEFPAVSILRAVSKKDTDEVDDKTLIMADIAAKAMAQVENTIFDILRNKFEENKAHELAHFFSEGSWTHDYPITFEKLAALGLPVKKELLREVYLLMDFYPQPVQRRPSVQYVPLPSTDRTRV